MYHDVNTILEAHGVRVARSLVGSYITSLEMAGTSVTLLKVDDEQLRLWDAPVSTPALSWAGEGRSAPRRPKDSTGEAPAGGHGGIHPPPRRFLEKEYPGWR